MGDGTGPALSRRQLMAAAGAMAIVGFDPTRRLWVGEARAEDDDDDREGLPRLDGTLHFDEPTRRASSTDQGNFETVMPLAVLRPGSVRDIERMVAFCSQRGIPVSARGAGHTTYGQGLTTGLIVEMRSLGRIHSISAAGAEVDAGVLWSDLVRAAHTRGFALPVLTGYLGLTVGGTLAVGGLSPSCFTGMQIERVRQLEVVDGRGKRHICSRTREAELFDAVRGGLGQFGIVTRAWLDVIPAPAAVRLWRLSYVEDALCLADFRTLLERAELDDCYIEWIPGQGQVRQIYAAKYFEAGEDPQGSHLLRGLRHPEAAAPGVDSGYLEHVTRVTPQVELLQATGYDSWQKPWYDVFLPDSGLDAHLAETLPQVTPLDVGEGFVLVFAQRRSRNTSSTYPYPQADGSDWFYLFDILPALPKAASLQVQRMVGANRTRYEHAHSLGGTRYPIGALEFSVEDWKRQYGAERYERLRGLKRKHDPAGVLAQGVGMFQARPIAAGGS